jgi:hypothetical protein
MENQKMTYGEAVSVIEKQSKGLPQLVLDAGDSYGYSRLYLLQSIQQIREALCVLDEMTFDEMIVSCLSIRPLPAVDLYAAVCGANQEKSRGIAYMEALTRTIQDGKVETTTITIFVKGEATLLSGYQIKR